MHTQQARQIGSQYKASASLKTFFFWQNLYASWACWVIYGAIKHTLNQSLLGKKSAMYFKKALELDFWTQGLMLQGKWSLVIWEM